jgi:hypothetical protein
MADIIYKKNQPDRFQCYWDEYVEREHVSPRYTTLALANFLEMSAHLGLLKDDKSFVLVRDGKPVAIVFLPIEQTDQGRTITFAGRYVIAPLFSDEGVIKELFAVIDQIAVAERITKIMFAVDVLEHGQYTYNFLLRFGYLNASLLNYLIDLSLPAPLWRHCRKGHRSDIKKIMSHPDFSLVVVDQANPDYDVHEQYRLIHHLAAGRATRSKASFDSQFAKLQAGLAAIFAIKYQGQIIAASYFESHGDKVLYGSAAENPDYGAWPLYHSMVYGAMEYYKKHGGRWIEVSQPFNPSAQFGYYPDAKQINIGQFKRGFAGRWVDEYRGIKYFDQSLAAKEIEDFKQHYAKV